MAKLSKLKKPKSSENLEAGGTAPVTPTVLKANSTGPAAPPQGAYWKGRNFPPKPGSRRAKAQPARTTSSAVANLGERRFIPQQALPELQTLDEAKQTSLQLVEELQEFEEFKKDILPSLQRDLKAGLRAEEIVEKYKSLAAARMVSLLSDKKLGHTAAKDILDRGLGKAIERKAIKHQFHDMDEKQLDSLIQSRLKDIEIGEDDSDEKEE